MHTYLFLIVTKELVVNLRYFGVSFFYFLQIDRWSSVLCVARIVIYMMKFLFCANSVNIVGIKGASRQLHYGDNSLFMSVWYKWIHEGSFWDTDANQE